MPISACEIARLIRTGFASPREILEHCLEAYDLWEPHIHAWVEIDRAAARAQADRLTHEARSGRLRGPLHGVPIGVKDVIDVAGLPTRAGSRTRNGEGGMQGPAVVDAEVVRRLRQAGAIVLGKTVTTEFAFTDPAATRNPHDLAHTPGGSSSGSGAAVAAGIVPLALGTQTAGSLCRPAAYCGVTAFKPTRGLVPLDGVVPCGLSFDTVGVIARSTHDAAAYLMPMLGDALLATPTALAEPRRPLRFGLLPERYYASTAEPQALEALHQAADGLSSYGHVVAPFDPATDFGAVVRAHRTVMVADAYRAHGWLLDSSGPLLGPLFKAALQEGQTIGPDERGRALRHLEQTTSVVWRAATGFDALLLLPTTGAAPRGVGSTGSQEYLTPWTAFGGPLFVTPCALSEDHLPLAVMLATAPGRDAEVVAAALALQSTLPELAPPSLP